MKLLLIIITLLLTVFFYLLFSYVRFYHIIGDVNLQTPYTDGYLQLKNPQVGGSAKYIALGDSLTTGVGSSNTEDTFAYQYGVNLSEKYGEVTILNLSQPGGITVDVINNQITPAIDAKPTHITLLIGTNDIHNKMSQKEFRENYQYILNELLTKTDAQVTVINIPYLGSNKSVYLPFNFLLNFRIKQFNKIISNLVNNSPSKYRIKFVDLYKNTYSEFKQNPKYYSEDLFHPSGEGYLLWSKIINAN